MVFDVTMAKQMVGGKNREIHQLSAEEVRSMALSRPPQKGYTTISLFNVDKSHLSHIPDRTEPVIFGTLRNPGVKKRANFILDGRHRMVRAAQEGRGVSTYVLTVSETRRCTLPDSHSGDRRLR
jgi:hypothetical protein